MYRVIIPDHCIEIDKLQVKFDAEVCISWNLLAVCAAHLYTKCVIKCDACEGLYSM